MLNRISVRIPHTSVALLLLSGLTFASTPLPRAAVYPLTQIGTDSTSAQVLTEALGMEVLRTGKARIMERSQIQAILAEQGFNQSGACSASECAVEIGRLLGVDRMVVGSLGKVEDVIVLNARLIDMSTGEVLAVSSRQTRNGVAGLLDGEVSVLARELLSGPKSTAVASEQASSVGSNSQFTMSNGTYRWLLPSQVQTGIDGMLFLDNSQGYHGVAVGGRLRLFWDTPLQGLTLGGGAWYADNLVRSSSMTVFTELQRDYGIHVAGGSLCIRETLPISPLLSASLGAEHGWARFNFDSPKNGTFFDRIANDRWETLTSLALGLHFTPPSPLSFDISYGPGLLTGDAIHRAELGVTYSFP